MARVTVDRRELDRDYGKVTCVDDETDAVVISASLTSPACFGVIFDRHATVLHRYLVRRLGPGEADGLFGETFRIAFEKRATYDLERSSARPWLYGIATNLVAKHRRSEARRIRAVARLAGQRVAGEDMTERAVGPIDATRRWERVAEAITALPEPDRDVLVLHVWEGLGYDEIAAALAIPMGTVRSRLNRVRRRLRELDDTGGREQGEHTRRDPGKITS
jgi:RNA polymerase sigma factor (sigma-70 family)